MLNKTQKIVYGTLGGILLAGVVAVPVSRKIISRRSVSETPPVKLSLSRASSAEASVPDTPILETKLETKVSETPIPANPDSGIIQQEQAKQENLECMVCFPRTKIKEEKTAKKFGKEILYRLNPFAPVINLVKTPGEIHTLITSDSILDNPRNYSITKETNLYDFLVSQGVEKPRITYSQKFFQGNEIYVIALSPENEPRMKYPVIFGNKVYPVDPEEDRMHPASSRREISLDEYLKLQEKFNETGKEAINWVVICPWKKDEDDKVVGVGIVYSKDKRIVGIYQPIPENLYATMGTVWLVTGLSSGAGTGGGADGVGIVEIVPEATPLPPIPHPN